VRNLLLFSRAAGPECVPLDLNEAVKGALTLIQTKATLSAIKVEAQLASSLPRIMGQNSQIQQMVINLATNAIDAMEAGGRLTIITELSAPSSVRLKVVDNGKGIPPALQSRIFEPFFTTKPIGQGTGLGLSLVFELVRKHSAEIDLQSRPGHTEFTILFPVA
jgi:signal transduction histidine kinase